MALIVEEWNLQGCNKQHEYVGLVGVNIVYKRLVVQLFQNQRGEINNSPKEYLECDKSLLLLKPNKGE